MRFIFIVSAALLMSACSNNAKVQGVKDSLELSTPKASVEKKTITRTTTSTANTPDAVSSESGSAAKTNTGWSKTAKGAVIGGVVGAGTRAVVNKKNRVAGAVVGGVVGAGAGAVIGNEMDKKDGRH